MKFTTSSNSLLKVLQQIGGIITSNTVMAVLEDFLFELNGNMLSITATDLETMMRVQIEVQEVDKDGMICIPSKILMEYLKNLPDQPITFTVSEKDLSVEMSSTVGKYRIGGESAGDFPKEPKPGEATTFTMPSIGLVEAIKTSLFAVSNDTLRPAMTGVYFELDKEGINFVATDAHRLVQFGRKDIQCPKKDGFVVPKKPLNQLHAILPATDVTLTLSYNASHLFVTTDKVSLCCRLIDAKFPDYKAVVPQDNPYTLIIDRKEVLASLKRVSIFTNRTTNQVVFRIAGNSLEISGADIDFSYEGKETMSCDYSGSDMMIAFNARLMIEMLGILTGSNITIHLSSPTRAAIFKQVENDENVDMLMLLMPFVWPAEKATVSNCPREASAGATSVIAEAQVPAVVCVDLRRPIKRTGTFERAVVEYMTALESAAPAPPSAVVDTSVLSGKRDCEMASSTVPALSMA